MPFDFSRSLGWGALLFLLLLLPFWSFAQERAISFSLGVVSPLNGDVFSTPVILQAVPSLPEQADSVDVVVSYEGVEESFVLSRSSSWMSSWTPPSSFEGDVLVRFRACANSSCVDESRTLRIVRAPPAVVREDVSSSHHRVRSSDVPSSPTDSSPESVSLFSVDPGNVFAFSETVLGGDRVVSTGDDFLLPSGRYDFSQSFPEHSFFHSLSLEGVVVSQSGVLMEQFTPPVSPFLEFRGDYFEVDHFWGLDVGFDFTRGSLSVPLEEGLVLFSCSLYSFESESCRVTWTPVSVTGSSWVSDFDSRRVVWVAARRLAAPPIPVPTHAVVASNVPGDYYVSSARGGVSGPFSTESFSLVQGQYSFSLHFFEGPLKSVRASDVNVNHSGTFLSIQEITPSSAEEGVELWVFALDYADSDVAVSLPRNIDPSSLRYCPSWSRELGSCSSRWSLGSFSFLVPGVSALQFTRRATTDSPVVPDVNVSGVDPLLVQTISDLKLLHTNKRYFTAPRAQEEFEVLSRLFSEVEVDLECSPASPSILPFSLSPSLREAVPLLSAVRPSSEVTLSEVPLDYWDADTPFFYTNEWESFLSTPSDWRQRENNLECDSVSLDHTFVFDGVPPDTDKVTYLGGSLYRAKETLVLTNRTGEDQVRRVNIRLTSPLPSLESESSFIVPSSEYVRIPSRVEHTEVFDSSVPEGESFSYSTIRDSFLRFYDREGVFVGTYDWSDFLSNGFAPQTVVHARDGSSVIETLLSVRIPAYSSVLLDPVYDLNQQVNYSVRFAGGVTTDYLGTTNTNFGALSDNPQSLGVEWVNADNNSYANDLLINSVYADVNGKADVGAIYLIKDADYLSGSLDMNSMSNYAVRWNGRTATDRIGYPFVVGDGMQLVDLDGNGYTNDLVITASLADYAASDVGAVILIKDIDRKPRQEITDLNFTSNFAAMWVGRTASDDLGYTNQSGQGVQIHNLDNEPVANDLIIVSGLYDAGRRVNNGAIFIILDANGYSGVFDTNVITSFTSAIWGARFSDSIGGSFQSGESVLVRNTDGNAVANDLFIACGGCDVGDTNGHGIIYGIKDVHTRSGILDLNVSTSYNFRILGRGVSDGITLTSQNGQGLFVEDTDGNGYKNDIIINARSSNQAGTTRGAIYYIRDSNTLSGDHNVASSTRVNLTLVGATNADQIGSSFGSGDAIQLVNVDGNIAANDLLVTSYLHNSGLTDNGAVFYINDINTRSGTLTLNTTVTNFTALFEGARASDFLGDINFSGQGVQLVNVDGNARANDLLIGAMMADTDVADTGALYLVKDINAKSGVIDFNTSTAFDVRFARHTDRKAHLGSVRGFGQGFQLANVDGNSYANDLIFAAPLADVNGKTDNGIVYLVKDVDKRSGIVDVNTAATAPTVIAWNGQATGDWLGHNAGSGKSFRIVNLDNNSYANDLLIADSNADFPRANTGALYLIRDVGSIAPGFYDLNSESNFTKAWAGSTATDAITFSMGSLDGDQNVNIDNNSYANDLIITAPQVDTNSKTNSGAVYLLRDVAISSTVVLDYSFVLNLPSSGCTFGKGRVTAGNGACEKGYIETTDTNVLSDENKVSPEGQSSTVPFFVYDNQSTSSSDLNIYLDINASLPTSLRLKVSKIFAGWAFTCTGNTDTNCVQLTTSQQSVGKATYSAGAQDLNIFIWGDFNAASVGDVDRNVDSNAGSST